MDNYLGSEHQFYGGIKKYIAKDLKESQIAPDVASAYARSAHCKTKKADFLAQMVFYRKGTVFKGSMVAQYSRCRKNRIFGGSTDNGHNDNEEEMWRYFVEKELFYSTTLNYQRVLLIQHLFKILFGNR